MPTYFGILYTFFSLFPKVISEARDYLIQQINLAQYADDGDRQDWDEGASQNGFMFAPVST